MTRASQDFLLILFSADLDGGEMKVGRPVHYRVGERIR
ncbi:hypothetical protein SynA1560_00915 [Synechococcus sp. A15-60]|nr:hypothetical protein SynA1560_00915 [Synechococcus sp. A15-60]